jgi:hypothetical protein
MRGLQGPSARAIRHLRAQGDLLVAGAGFRDSSPYLRLSLRANLTATTSFVKGILGAGVDSDLTALASSAATTLVGLMVTDAWERFKTAVVSLWQRAHPDRAEAVGDELAAARLEVLAAREAQDEQAELDLVTEWRGRLRRLVAGDPQLAEELRRLVAEFSPDPAQPGITQSVSMQATASGHGRVYQAGRDQKIVER